MHIDRFRFGSIRIDGVDFGRDVVILGDTVYSPWWRSAGGHVFAPVDFADLFEAPPDAVCLGTGALGMVMVDEALIEAFDAIGCEVFVERTGSAVVTFNRLSSAGRDVAAALHLTC